MSLAISRLKDSYGENLAANSLSVYGFSIHTCKCYNRFMRDTGNRLRR